MSVKKSSKQKNTRHHISTAPSITKKNSKKAKLRNQDLRSQLDKATGLAGAVNLFAQPKKPRQEKTKEQKDPESGKEMEKAVEDDTLALMSMQLSATKAH